MADEKLTHVPAEGEGTPALPGESDLASRLKEPAGRPDPETAVKGAAAEDGEGHPS